MFQLTFYREGLNECAHVNSEHTGNTEKSKFPGGRENKENRLKLFEIGL